jgi:hypothetical protein
MEIKLRLAEADRERYGAPEELSVDPNTISFQETVVIQKGVEIEGAVCSFDSASQWGNAVSTNDPFAMIVLIWIALRRAGIKVPLSEVDASLVGLDLEVIRDPADETEPGKDPSTPETTS